MIEAPKTEKCGCGRDARFVQIERIGGHNVPMYQCDHCRTVFAGEDLLDEKSTFFMSTQELRDRTKKQSSKIRKAKKEGIDTGRDYQILGELQHELVIRQSISEALENYFMNKTFNLFPFNQRFERFNEIVSELLAEKRKSPHGRTFYG